MLLDFKTKQKNNLISRGFWYARVSEEKYVQIVTTPGKGTNIGKWDNDR